MDIVVNGEALEVGAPETGRLGEALAVADDLIEKSGAIIVGLRVDGAQVDAEGYAGVAERAVSGIGIVEISAEPASAIRIKALETLLELLGLLREAALESGPGAWPSLRSSATDLRDAFAGLFAADELSFVQALSSLLDRAGDLPDPATRVEISGQADRLEPLFKERLAEHLEPAREMRAAALLFAAQEAQLAELPVFMQTGKEDIAMKVVLYFIEVFNKVIRLIPELKRSGLDTEVLKIEGLGLADFYAAFNEVLRELTRAFEDKDAVLIGDLAEYEVLPRMKGFFAAMEAALQPR